MQFPDNRADTIRHSAARFDSMLYSVGAYNGQPYRQGSLNDYFIENSYGAYHVRGAIAGNRWFTSSYNYSRYYDGNYLLSTGSQLASENVQQVDGLVDFRQFDINGDGHIDAMFMVHAGADGADNGDVNCLWSHAIPWFNYQTNDGVIIDGVTNVPEFAMVTAARETTLCCIAVMCHELGHLVGLPDLYDYSRNTWGIGYWGLMGYGAWGAGGCTPWSPSHMEAWSKVEAGFVQPSVITTNTYSLRIPDVETNPVIYKVWRQGRNTDTCFYLENRQRKGFDSPLPGPGLLIWHIDPAMGSSHNIVDLEEDSTFHLDRGTGVRPDPHLYHQALGDTSDPLPGNWNRTVFDSASVPSSRDRLGRSTGVCITRIRQEGDTIVCDVIVRPESVAIAEMAASPHPAHRLFSILPNPCSGTTVVKLHNRPVDASTPCKLVISDILGRRCWQTAVSTSTISLPKLPSGVYIVQVSDRVSSAGQPLVVTP